MNTFFHEISNALAIAHGKVSIAKKLLNSSSDSEQLELVKKQLQGALDALERMHHSLKNEKITHLHSAAPVETIVKKGAA